MANYDNADRVEFRVRDCALAAIGTGYRARDMRELRYQLLTIPADCLYYHFWGTRLRPRFGSPEYINDFAEWASNGLHDTPLAERVGVLDPTNYDSLGELRSDLIDVIDERLDEVTVAPWARADRRFEFVRGELVLFNTNHRLHRPADLAEVLPHLTTGSVYYHVIDARGRTEEGHDDFSVWLEGYGEEYAELILRIREVNPYFLALDRLRDEFARICNTYFEDA